MKGILKSCLNEESIPRTHSRAGAKALEWEEAGKVESHTEGRGKEIETSRWCLDPGTPSPRHRVGTSLKP